MLDEQAAGSWLELLRSPDADIGDEHAEERMARSMQIDLPAATIEEIRKCVHAGKSVQLCFGQTQALRCGENVYPLYLSPSSGSSSSFRHELYKPLHNHDHQLEFASLLKHRMAIADAKEATTGAESSLATLQASLAQYQKEKEENSATFIGDQNLGNPVKHGRTGSKAKKWKKGDVFQDSFSRSITSSPAFNASKQPPSSAPAPKVHRMPAQVPGYPAPIPLARARVLAQRWALFHCLAVSPATEEQILKSTGLPKEDLPELLEKYTRKIPDTDQWGMTDRWYKELDVWDFNYKSDMDRQYAIENSIHAFDRQRISKDDKLWQLLLPKAHRDKGICLSKLNIGDNPSYYVTYAAPVQAKDRAPSDHRKSLAALDDTTTRSGSPGSPQGDTATSSKAAAAKKSQSKETTTTTKPSTTTKGAVATKKSNKANQTQVTDFGDPDEGSSDLEEAIAALSSGAERKKKLKAAEKNTTVVKKPTTGTKRKAETKFKSEEFIEDSSDLVEEEDDDDDKPLAEKAEIEHDRKRLKINDKGAKATIAPKSSEPPAQKKAVQIADKNTKVNPVLKDRPAQANVSNGDNMKKVEPRGASSNQQSSAVKGNAAMKSVPNPPPPSKPKPKDATAQQNGTKAAPPSAKSALFGNSVSKKTPVHIHSSSVSSSNSNASAGLVKSGTKRQAEDQGSSQGTPVKKQKLDDSVGKATAQSSSSPFTNASDPPNLSSQDEQQSSPSKKPNDGKLGKNTNLSKKGSTGANKILPTTEKPQPNGNVASKPNGTHKVAAETSVQNGSPNHALITGLKEQYSAMFKEHIVNHLALDKLPADAISDLADYNSKFAELQSLAKTIEIMLRRSGRGDETFDSIPDDFESASVPGLMEHVNGKIAGLRDRYGAERDSCEGPDGGFSEEDGARLNVLYDEILELEALRDH